MHILLYGERIDYWRTTLIIESLSYFILHEHLTYNLARTRSHVITSWHRPHCRSALLMHATKRCELPNIDISSISNELFQLGSFHLSQSLSYTEQLLVTKERTTENTHNPKKTLVHLACSSSNTAHNYAHASENNIIIAWYKPNISLPIFHHSQ